MRIRARSRLGGLAFACGGFVMVLAGCGHCDGAVRLLRINSVGVCGLEECEAEGGVTKVGSDVTFRIVGDGPTDESDVLLADSAVGPDTFFLVDENDEVVPASVTGDSGGHSCRNGVGFSLLPDEPLPLGTYTVVVVIDDLAWPHVGRADTQQWEGKEAFVREIEVTEEIDPEA